MTEEMPDYRPTEYPWPDDGVGGVETILVEPTTPEQTETNIDLY